MASFNFYLKDGNSKKDTAIYLLFDDGVNNGKLYIQQSINPKDWNSKAGQARKTIDGFADFNAKLDKIQTTCKELHTSLTKDNIFTIPALRQNFKEYLDVLNNRKRDKTGETKTYTILSDFASDYIKSVETTKKKNTLLQYKQTLGLLTAFETKKGKKITFEKVNLDFYNDFMDYLTNEKKYSPNTRGKHIQNIKMFLNEATERGINTKLDYKSKRFKTTSESVENIYLNETELDTIYEYDFTEKKKLEQVRDLFIIGCFTGLRFSDFSQLNLANIVDGHIKVKTQKTGEMVEIPLHPKVREILKKYESTHKGLPRAISNQKMNEYLKEMGRKVGINDEILQNKVRGSLKAKTTVFKYDLITTHTARRSFATNLYLSGFPAISIMKITGHRSERAFMKYIKVSGEENANLLDLHWKKQTMLKSA